MQRSLKNSLKRHFLRIFTGPSFQPLYFNSFYKDVDFVFISLNILRSMIRKKVDYYHFYIDSSVETNGLENVIKILKKKKTKYYGRHENLVRELLRSNLFCVVPFNALLSSSGPLRKSWNE